MTIEFKQRWNHGPDRNGRYRGGKTAADRAGGAAHRAAQRKLIPIRCTSSHEPSRSMEREPGYWGG